MGNLSALSEEASTRVIRDLTKWGMGGITFWTTGEAFDSRIGEGIRIPRIPEQLY